MNEPAASNTHDAQCIYEASLEKLRIEYNLTSQQSKVAARAKTLTEAYWGKGSKAAERAMLNFYRK